MLVGIEGGKAHGREGWSDWWLVRDRASRRSTFAWRSDERRRKFEGVGRRWLGPTKRERERKESRCRG